MISLDAIKTRAEFERLLREHRPATFLCYRSIAASRTSPSIALLRYLAFDPAGKRCLDIGPGHDVSLDIWRDSGAAECAFIEKDPWFFTHNRLKGFRGWRINHLKGVCELPQRYFDVVWMRGAISVHRMYFRLLGKYGFRRWIAHIENLAAQGGIIVICPYWLCRDGVRLIERPENHWLTSELESRGYRRLPFIEGHNLPNEYPITWVLEKGKGPGVGGAGPRDPVGKYEADSDYKMQDQVKEGRLHAS